MTTWIIGIDKHNPQHWAMAQQHGYWDITRHRLFEVGDTLAFWQAGASLLGAVRVTHATYELPRGAWMPWNIHDEKRGDYRYRVEFEVISPTAAEQPTWSELATATGVRAATNFGPQRVPTATGEAWLRDQIGVAGGGPSEVSPRARELATKWSSLDQGETDFEVDLRDKVLASIVIRRGQGAFRRDVLRAYGSRCAITGTGLESVLDAAHVLPYRGSHTDTVDNGLLLRTDLHTLFDLHLLTIEPDTLVVRVAPSVPDPMYRDLDGRRLDHFPEDPGDRPRRQFLARHNAECEWYSTTDQS